jgi:Domain of unknown function (DUF4157)
MMGSDRQFQQKPQYSPTSNQTPIIQTRPFAPIPQLDTQQETPQQDLSRPIPSLNPSRINFSFAAAPPAAPISHPLQRKLMGSPVQAKLSIGAVGDKYEQEADQVASQVVQKINAPENLQRDEEEQVQAKPLESIQREELPEEEELQMKPLAESIQRVEEEEEELQMKPTLQRRESAAGGDASEELESSIQQAKGGGQSLDSTLQTKMGQAMGADFSGVKVHTDSQSDRLNKSIQAKAFTTGQDVFFRQGAYDPGSRGGQELIAHELTHVVQQKSEIKRKNNTRMHASGTIQRVIEGFDPIADNNVLDVAHINDLMYGLTNYRGATMARMAEAQTQKRSVDQYNASVGLDGNVMNGRMAYIGVYLVRNALENPTQWRAYLPASQAAYPNDQDLMAYMQGGGALTNEQKWMTFLVREKRNIGLWDLGNTERPVIGRNIFGQTKKGKAGGLAKIENKRRFEKNMHEDDEGSFSETDVHKMLSFGTDIAAAQAYYGSLGTGQEGDAKKQGINRWIQNAFWRRTSKLGIDFATSDIGLNARVHFNMTSGAKQEDGSWTAQLWGILDDIAADQGTRKITESEWRYVQRMMKQNPAMLRKIIPYSEH